MIIEPHYFGNIALYACMLQSPQVVWDIHHHYEKQSYRNRTEILSPNGMLKLIVPVKCRNHTPFKEVKIDYAEDWVKLHWGAIITSYGKSPFFEFLAWEIKECWESKTKFLLDLNFDLMAICLKYIQQDLKIEFTCHYNKKYERPDNDMRGCLHPKKAESAKEYYLPTEYFQNFGLEFVPNLSILDVLFHKGNESKKIILNSTF